MFDVSQQEVVFTDPNSPQSNNIESQIASVLWEWKFAEPDRRDAIIKESRLSLMIQFWFPFSLIEVTKRLGTWCDGIPLLVVDQTDRVTFSVSGVGEFPTESAAFETEWHFKNRRDLVPASIILRLGYVR